MPVRNLETYINDQTVKDLIISHLVAISVINNYEDVKDLGVSEVQSDGLRKLNIYFDKDVQTIFHP
jgi:hypothetical protein